MRESKNRAPLKAARVPKTRLTREAAVEIFPYGFSMANGPARPVLIFKDKTGQHVLPVWMHPLDATMALHEQASRPIEPHVVAKELMSALGLEASRCEIGELSGHRQYARLEFQAPLAKKSDLRKKSAPKKSVRVRADYAMSFCLSARMRFFSTPNYMARCRALGDALDGAGEGAQPLQAIDSGLMANEKRSKPPSYMM